MGFRSELWTFIENRLRFFNFHFNFSLSPTPIIDRSPLKYEAFTQYWIFNQIYINDIQCNASNVYFTTKIQLKHFNSYSISISIFLNSLLIFDNTRSRLLFSLFQQQKNRNIKWMMLGPAASFSWNSRCFNFP